MNKKFFLIFIFSILLVPSFLFARIVGTIVEKKGRVDVFKSGSNFAVPVHVGDAVYVGDVFRAKSNSFAKIEFTNKNILKIFQRTKVEIDKYMLDNKRTESTVNLYRGKVQAKTAKHLIKKIGYLIERNKFEVHTPTAVAGVKGTNFIVFHFKNVTGVLFLEGHGYAYNPNLPDKVVPMKAGQITFLTNPGSPPSEPRKATEAEIKTLVKAAEKNTEKQAEGGKSVKTANNKPSGEKKDESGSEQSSSEGEKRAGSGETGKSAKSESSPSVPEDLDIITAFAKNTEGSIENTGGKVEVELNLSSGSGTGDESSTGENGDTTKQHGDRIPITENPEVKEELTQEKDKNAPEIDEFSLYKNFIPKNGEIKVKVSDDKELKKTVIYGKDAVVDESGWQTVEVKDLALKNGLNSGEVRATDSSENIASKILKLFYSPEQTMMLSGKYIINKDIKGSVSDSALSLLSSEGKGAASVFTESESQLPDNAKIIAGGSVLNAAEEPQGYWLNEINSEKNKFVFLTDSGWGETNISDDFPVLKYNSDKTALISNHLLETDINKKIKNPHIKFVKQISNESDSEELSDKMKGFIHLFPDNSLMSLGQIDTSENNFIAATDDDFEFNLESDKITAGAGIAVFKDTIYGKLIGYNISDLGDGKYEIEMIISDLQGNVYRDIGMYKLISEGSFEKKGIYTVSDPEKNLKSITTKDYNSVHIEMEKESKCQFAMDIDYSDFANISDAGATGGAVYGGFEGKILDSDVDLTEKDEYQIGTGANNPELYFAANMKITDTDDSSFLSEISGGAAMSKTKIADNLEGYAVGNYNTKEFQGFLIGSWQHLKYVATMDTGVASAVTSTADPVFKGLLGSAEPLLLEEGETSKYIILATYENYNTESSHTFSTKIESFDFEKNKPVTYQEDAFSGFVSCVTDAQEIKGTSIALFSNKDGHVGILKEQGLEGGVYPDFESVKMQGEWSHIYMNDETGLDSPYYFSDSINDYSPDSTNIEMKRINNEKWGIFRQNLNSDVEAAIKSEPENTVFETGYNIPEITDTGIVKDVYGYGGKISSTGVSTWISISDVVGIQKNNSFNAIVTGAWLETGKFLALAELAHNGDSNAESILNNLKIPFVQVGKTTLSGTGNNLDITMNDVTFFATSTGAKPSIWATKDIVGSFSDVPEKNVPVPLKNTGGTISADFTVRSWSNNQWIATVDNGKGHLSENSYSGEINFRGVAAGTYNSIPQFPGSNDIHPAGYITSGTAAGIVK